MINTILQLLPFSNEQLIMYINLGIIGIMVLFAFIGFLRGTYKSVYYMIATLIVFVGGWLLSDLFCKILFKYDFTQFGISFDLDGTKCTLSTINDLVYNVIGNKIYGGTIPEDALVLETVMALVKMVVKLVYFIILVILSFTVFKWIFDILWLIFRPKKKDGIRRKPKFLSRLGGFGIGAVKGLMYVLLLLFTVAGIASIAQSLQPAAEEDKANVQYTIILVDDTATLVKTGATEEKTSALSEYQEYLDLLLCYEDTIAGKVFGTVKIKEAGLDEFVFDQLYSIKVKSGDKEYDVKFREELKKVASVISEVPALLEGGFSLETLANLPKEDLTKLVDNLTSLDIINLAIPVGIEVVLANDKLLANLGDENMQGLVKNVLEGMKGIDDYNAEFKHLGYAFVDILSLMEFNEDGSMKLDFLSFDGKTVEEIFASLGEMGIIDIIAPIAIEYICSMESFKASLQEFGINIDEILHPENYGGEAIKWSDEITQIGKIYSSLTSLGLSVDDLKSANINSDEETLAKIDNLVEEIFNSKVISKAIPAVVNVATTKLPEQYNDVLIIKDNIEWKNELKPLLKAIIVILSTGMLGENADIMETLKGLDDAKIDQLAEYLSESSVITESLNGLITKLLASGEEGSSSMLGDIELHALDSAADWDKAEIGSIFKALKVILDSGIIGSEDTLTAVGNLSDATIDSLALNLSSSKFIKKNLSGILEFVMNGLSENSDLQLVSLQEDEWTQVELASIFKAVKDIASSGILGGEGTDGIANLSDETIDSLAYNLSHSMFLKKNLSALVDMLLSSVDLGDGIKITCFEDPDDWTEEEISSLFKAAKLIVGVTDDLTKIVNFDEDKLDVLMGSKLISDVLVSFIKEYTKEGGALEIVKGADQIADDAWTDTKTDATFAISGNVVTITPVPGQVADKYYVYDGKVKLGSTKALSYDLADLADTTNVKVVAYEFGEIRKLFLGVQAILGDDFDTATIGDDIMGKITNLQDENIVTIVDSRLLAETIIVKLEEFANDANAIINIPEGALTNTEDRSAWLEQDSGAHGELFNALKAITVVFNGADLGSASFDLNNVIESRDTVLRSLVISETLRVKILSIDAIDVPEGEAVASDSLTGWSNTYDVNGNVTSRGELDALLVAIKICLGIDGDFDISSINTDNINLSKIIYQKDEVLKSVVISNTLRTQIQNITSLDKPSTLSTTDLTGWKSTYDADGNVTSYGELANVLLAIKYILNVQEDSETTLTSLTDSFSDIKLNSLIDNREKILRSGILTETVKTQILSNSGTLILPAGYDNTSSPNYIAWSNTYVDGAYDNVSKEITYTVSNHGEIDNILGAIGSLLSDTNVGFSNISSFNFGAIFDPTSQKSIISSKVISETIIDKLTANGGLKVPNDPAVGLIGNADRSAWWNTENGELIYFLNAVGSLISDEQKDSLTDINLDISSTFAKITDTTVRTNLLSSYVLAETITYNFANLSLFEDKMPTVAQAGVNFSATNLDGSDNREAWYKINVLADSRTIEHKEVWNLISSIYVLLGNNFDTSKSFDMDQVLGNPAFVPSLDANKNNSNTSVNTLLASKIIENTFVEVISELFTGSLATFFNMPTSPLYYEYQYSISTQSNKEYDTKTIIESLYQMQAGGLNYKALSSVNANTLNNIDSDELADAFVISRTYNLSINKFFNTIFGSLYTAAYYSTLADLDPTNNIPPYADVAIDSANYAGMTKAQTSAQLADDLDVIIDYIQGAMA